MKLIIAVIAICSLTACSKPTERITLQAKNPVDTALTDYICTTDEMKRVESEALFCNKNTSYFTSYCYGSAIMRICKVKEGHNEYNSGN